MSEFKKDNHYIPQFYLKNWSLDDKKVWVYRKLIPNKKCITWKDYSISSIAKQMHLYTSIAGGVESDAFENWFNDEFETPVQEAYYKAIKKPHISSKDWEILIKYTAAQIVRTPSFYIKNTQLMGEKIIPNILNNALPKAIKKIEDTIRAKGPDAIKHFRKSDESSFESIIKVHTDIEKSQVNVKINIGRESWLASMRHILTNTYKVLLQHKWSIVKIHDEIYLVTSDDPVICLNYWNNHRFNFDGGWNSKNSEIIFPLNPNYILYTKIGESLKSRLEFNKTVSSNMQKIIAVHAHRYIYGIEEDKNINVVSPRIISEEQYKREKEMWKNWHNDQSR